MAEHRSIIDANVSLQRAISQQYDIQPEYLGLEELEHELCIRGRDPRGDHRALGSRLRPTLSQERNDPNVKQLRSVGSPDQEFDNCRRQMTRLRVLLAQVTHEPHTHERFMTPFLHVEGRLNRLTWPNETPELLQRVSEQHDILTDLYQEFVAKNHALHRVVSQSDVRLNHNQPQELIGTPQVLEVRTNDELY